MVYVGMLKIVRVQKLMRQNAFVSPYSKEQLPLCEVHSVHWQIRLELYTEFRTLNFISVLAKN